MHFKGIFEYLEHILAFLEHKYIHILPLIKEYLSDIHNLCEFKVNDSIDKGNFL